jgi:hypothetical protein
MKRKTGIVEKIEFTIGGLGNQYTTIDCVKYITYWDFADGVKVGARVEFTEEENGVVQFGNLRLIGPRAREIKVLTPAS